MENKLIDIIFELLKDRNLYNYDNDNDLKNVTIEKYINILGQHVIDFKINDTVYTITCNATYKGV